MVRFVCLVVALLLLHTMSWAALTQMPTQVLEITTGFIPGWGSTTTGNIVTVRYCDGRFWEMSWKFASQSQSYTKNIPMGFVSSLQIHAGNDDGWILGSMELNSETWPGGDDIITVFDGDQHDDAVGYNGNGITYKRVRTRTFSLVCPDPIAIQVSDIRDLLNNATSGLAAIKTQVDTTAQDTRLADLTNGLADLINEAITKVEDITPHLDAQFNATFVCNTKTGMSQMHRWCAVRSHLTAK